MEVVSTLARTLTVASPAAAIVDTLSTVTGELAVVG